MRLEAMRVAPPMSDRVQAKKDLRMQNNRTSLAMLPLVAACITAPALATLLAAGLMQGERISRPAISEQTSPLEPIAPVARDGYRGKGFLRKPPGDRTVSSRCDDSRRSREHGQTEELKKYALDVAHPSRFLAAGYAVAVITFRSRDDDPQSRVSAEDSLAAVNHVRRLSYVDPKSVVVYGCSGGGDLALEVAAMTDVTALAAEEPAAVHFTGITDKNVPRSGPRFTPDDSLPILADPKRYYTTKYQTIARDKIGRIRSPILIVQGDQHPLNRFNREVLIPELQSAGNQTSNSARRSARGARQ